MKQKLLFLQVFVLLFAGLFSSCSSDDDESSFSDIIGTWSGTYTYYNPVGGQKYQYLTIWFYENGTGELEYESPTSSSFASFIYSVAGNVVMCQGAWANSDADYDVNFAMTLRIDGDRLIPQDRYSAFILTRDGSIVTDSSGIVSDNNNSNEDSGPGEGEVNESDENKKSFYSLKGTSWTLEEMRSNKTIPSGYYKYIGETLTFSGEYLGEAINAYGEKSSNFGKYKFYSSSFSGYGIWMIEKDGSLGFYLNEKTNNTTSAKIGGYCAALACGGKIISLTQDRMCLKARFDDIEYYYRKNKV